jgi:hypothetical protein
MWPAVPQRAVRLLTASARIAAAPQPEARTI